MLSYLIQKLFFEKFSFFFFASVADTGAVNPNGRKALLASGVNTFFIKSKTFLSIGLRSLLRKPPDSPILYNWVFDNFILDDELFAKTLQGLKTCVLFNNNLGEKLVSSLELAIIFDERFKVTSIPFFISELWIW